LEESIRVMRRGGRGGGRREAERAPLTNKRKQRSSQSITEL
jgi:hypothetical protein